MLRVIAGELCIAEAAAREKVGETSIGRWSADFLGRDCVDGRKIRALTQKKY